ncbi:MAG: ATP-dependent DNA helicase RecG [FCB group bacterium]|jgi:ATP-dependent DNA helicase RecG
MAEKSKEIVSELQYIKGVGPVKAKALAAIGITTPIELLYYFPRNYIDRNAVSSLKALAVKLRQENMFSVNNIPKTFSFKNEVTIVAQIINKQLRKYGKNKEMLILTLGDGTGGKAQIIFWRYTEYYSKIFNIEELVSVSGKPELDKFGKINFNHPEIEKFDTEDEILYKEGAILPVYPMTQELKNARWTIKQFRQVISSILENTLQSFNETLPEQLRKKLNLAEIESSIKNLHFPSSTAEIERSKYRMKFEEIFYFEIFLALRQRGVKVNENGNVINPKSPKARKLFESLPFQLTSDQKKVIKEITDDMKSGKPMNRLLQGDVGSGKTIVAILTMLAVIDNGFQVAIMAPTEILAEQHYNTFKNYFEEFEINIVQLIGGQKTKTRNDILDKISKGKANVIIGTHAMFESTVLYNKLGLIVIDEQHRFGVAQRASLKKLAVDSYEDNSVSPHILVMSATPIPRTLAMTVYGDLDVSIIREMPKDRKPINTKVIFESQLNYCYNFIKKEIQNGHQAYIVFPLVEKSEKIELKAATEHFEYLKENIFPEFKCGLLHGQMFWYEKEDTMKAFLNKEYNILIATTVIEVGIDVPNATIMLINNAERFGLSTLHQLRGRVGRSSHQSYCFLAAKDNYQFEFKRKDIPDEERKAATIRLKTMEETGNGFVISEVDLKLRGPGDVLGTRQSGLPSFQFLDLAGDGDIITLARKEAFAIIENDAHLRKPENEIIRTNFLKQYQQGKNYFDVA